VDLAKLAAISSMGGRVTASPAPAGEGPAAWAADTVHISSTIPQKRAETDFFMSINNYPLGWAGYASRVSNT
jgi:hypothetical protein